MTPTTASGPEGALKPIFIVGYMHSGTSLLRKIIGRHPEVFSIRAETMFFDQLEHQIPRAYCNLNDDAILEEYVRFLARKTTFDWPPLTPEEAQREAQSYQPDEEVIQQIIAGARRNRDYVAIFAHVFESIAAAAGNNYWLEKTPSHIHHLPTIIGRVPGALCIELVRDPRDVLASKKVRKQSDWAERYGATVGANMQSAKGYDPLRDSLAWRAAVRAGDEARRRHPDRMYRLRYEDLAYNPETEIRRLCDFLGLTFMPEMLAVGWSNTTADTSAGRTSGIGKRAVGKWQGNLPGDVAGLCQMINGDEMGALGYDVQDLSLGQRVKAAYWVARSGADLLGRTYELWSARGPDYVKGMALNSWRRVGHLLKQ